MDKLQNGKSHFINKDTITRSGEEKRSTWVHTMCDDETNIHKQAINQSINQSNDTED
jgi:hypothetical protein